MCFDGCLDESKDLIEHYNNSDYHKDKKKDGFGTYHFFGSDHVARYWASYGIGKIIDILDNCGGYVP